MIMFYMIGVLYIYIYEYKNVFILYRIYEYNDKLDIFYCYILKISFIFLLIVINDYVIFLKKFWIIVGCFIYV